MIKVPDKKLEKIANKELYRLSKHEAIVDIGCLDTNPTFYPEVDLNRWGGECCLNISHADRHKIKKNAKPKQIIKNNNLELEIDIPGTGRRHRFKEGSLEWDIEYLDVSDLPKDNVEIFTLDFSEGLTWHHQPELTQAEINEGCFRPENIINSFAGYFNKSNGQYKTGKVCHIYRAKLIAKDGAVKWAYSIIVGNELQVSIDRDWCILHGFPVILDPYVGLNTVGLTGTSGLGGNYMDFFGPWVAGDTFNADTVYLYLHSSSSTSGEMTLGIYDNTASPNRVRLGDTAGISSLTAGDWNSGALDSSVSISSGSSYGVGHCGDTTRVIVYDTYSGVDLKYSAYTYQSGVLRNPFGSESTQPNRAYSAYFDGDEGGGSILPILLTQNLQGNVQKLSGGLM